MSGSGPCPSESSFGLTLLGSAPQDRSRPVSRAPGSEPSSGAPRNVLSSSYLGWAEADNVALCWAWGKTLSPAPGPCQGLPLSPLGLSLHLPLAPQENVSFRFCLGLSPQSSGQGLDLDFSSPPLPMHQHHHEARDAGRELHITFLLLGPTRKSAHAALGLGHRLHSWPLAPKPSPVDPAHLSLGGDK